MHWNCPYVSFTLENCILVGNCLNILIYVGGIKEDVATTEHMKIVGDVRDKVAILVTDLADTLAMETVMAESLIVNGAKAVGGSGACLMRYFRCMQLLRMAFYRMEQFNG